MTDTAPAKTAPAKVKARFPEAMNAPKRKATKYIVIHCAATKPDAKFDADDINEWHLKRGWKNGIGYHFVILRDGTIEVGRPIDAVGSHAKGVNAVSIGICLMGGLDDDDDAVANYTPEQWQSLRIVVGQQRKRYPNASVIGHCDVPDARKSCPNFDVKKWFSEQDFSNT